MTAAPAHRKFADVLLAHRAIAPDQLSAALAKGEGALAETLINEFGVDPERVARALAEYCRLPYVDLTGFNVSADLYRRLPAAHAYRYGVVPYGIEGDVLNVVISDPFNLALGDILERISGMRVRLHLSSAQAVSAAIKRSEGSSEVLRGVSQDFKLVMVREGDDGKEEYVSLDKIANDTSPVIKLVNTVLLAALQKRASDVHIETYEKGITVKYRIDGVLYPATEVLDRKHHSALVSRLKVMAELDIAEKRVPQDGRFKLHFNNRDIDFRVSILPSVFGEDVVIRILDKSSITDGVRNLRLEALGLSPAVMKAFRRAVREPYGLVLITGPTGSGKTTTLYAALGELDAGEEKVITIEDPVEYQLDGIVQIPVNEKKGLTFAKGLRSVLRHDPDKIMVGEIRDSETAQIAVQSALTGHLVFTTVHANNAFDVIGRFSHMGLDVYNFVSALNCVMAQRLIRVLCAHCRCESAASPELLELSGLDVRKEADTIWHEARGCEHCNGTGYRGRAAITEFLALSPRIRQMIVERRSATDLQATAIAEGMVTLRQSALAKARAGVTSLKEINRVTFIE